MSKPALLMIFAVFIVVTVIVWIIHLIKHKKKIALMVISCLIVFFIAFFIVFPTSFPFVDSWIVGRSKDEIINVYGEGSFANDITNGSKIGYHLGADPMDFIFNTNSCINYCIYFNKDDIAVRVSKESVGLDSRHPVIKVYNFFDKE